MNWHYLWWIPVAILFFSFYLCFFGLAPIWVLITRVTKNILLDGLIYDIIMILTFIFVMWYLGAGDKFSVLNWIGIFLIFGGLVCAKL